jgi:archaellum component FlaG (FlaF/FlaG flagellin family)
MLHIVTLLIAAASNSTTADKASSHRFSLAMSSEGSALADKIVWPKFLEHHLLV